MSAGESVTAPGPSLIHRHWTAKFFRRSALCTTPRQWRGQGSDVRYVRLMHMTPRDRELVRRRGKTPEPDNHTEAGPKGVRGGS